MGCGFWDGTVVVVRFGRRKSGHKVGDSEFRLEQRRKETHHETTSSAHGNNKVGGSKMIPSQRAWQSLP